MVEEKRVCGRIREQEREIETGVGKRQGREGQSECVED